MHHDWHCQHDQVRHTTTEDADAARQIPPVLLSDRNRFHSRLHRGELRRVVGKARFRWKADSEQQNQDRRLGNQRKSRS